MRSLVIAAVLVSFGAFAEDISPDKVAKVRMEKKAALDAVDKKYAGKKLSSSERKEMDKEKTEASLKVMEKNGVDPKAFARSEATMSKEDRAAADSSQKGLEKKAEDDAKAAEAKKKDGDKPKEIVVEKGGGAKGKGKGRGAGGLFDDNGPPPAAGTPEADAAEAAAADRAAGAGKGK